MPYLLVGTTKHTLSSLKNKISEFFPKKIPPLLGIDISSSAIKSIELAQGSNGIYVKHYAIEPLPPNTIIDNNIEDIDKLSTALRDIIQQLGTRTRKVATAISSSNVFNKIAPIPIDLSGSELEAYIETEVEQHVPYLREEINFDFKVLGASELDPDYMDTLLVACRSEYISTRITALKSARLIPTIIDVDTYVMERVFPFIVETIPNQDINSTIAVIDVGATLIVMNVFHNGKIIYTQEQAFGGNQLTQNIQYHYNLSYSDADLAKQRGNLPESYTNQILIPFENEIIKRIQNLIKIFFSSTHYNNISHLILCGGCATVPKLREMIEISLKIPTSIANPFGSMTLGSKINPKLLFNDAPRLTIACGLALRYFS
ncbi:type IV pilus assembly protein PilM [Candidatus Nitrosacidococcus tergens]|uniref:Type IV pilus assembly protein PilM n=1 Tax=Candidatus Nitrosacidococcus tergens TaxID=553981 RepID=A0A7G1Q7E8_9GAMM|nr:type IV pilus assembly protein PilM [Candidatus Nitrosacidococcus tergens]CAB1274230.1 Type IV pilus assembly protein PilM [Candidatus Nitrosacidococcus tergens]